MLRHFENIYHMYISVLVLVALIDGVILRPSVFVMSDGWITLCALFLVHGCNQPASINSQ